MTLQVNQVDLTQSLTTLQSTQQLCEAIMRTPHYARIGAEGIFAIVAKARSLQIDPLDALNGGLYCVQGKVEMSAQMMNQLIRMHGHSVIKDAKSDDTICILHGKRADTGDTWTESFSIGEARRAGIYKEGGSWSKYPRDMLFARALSRLARQLFPDVIKGCYVEGEIASAIASGMAEKRTEKPEKVEVVTTITQQEAEELQGLLAMVPEYEQKVRAFLQSSYQIDDLSQLTYPIYDRIRNGAMKKIAELTEALPTDCAQDSMVEVEEVGA